MNLIKLKDKLYNISVVLDNHKKIEANSIKALVFSFIRTIYLFVLSGSFIKAIAYENNQAEIELANRTLKWMEEHPDKNVSSWTTYTRVCSSKWKACGLWKRFASMFYASIDSIICYYFGGT